MSLAQKTCMKLGTNGEIGHSVGSSNPAHGLGSLMKGEDALDLICIAE